jgi:hypothetical protein
MYFRFGSALVLVVVVSLAGVAIEKQCLALRRAVMREQYRHEALCDASARLRLTTEQLGAPRRLLQALEDGRLDESGSKADSGDRAEPPPVASAEPAEQVKR